MQKKKRGKNSVQTWLQVIASETKIVFISDPNLAAI